MFLRPMGGSIARLFQNCTDSTGSKRARKQRSYYRTGDFFRKPSPTKTMSVSATAATCRSSRGSANNGFSNIQKRRKHSLLCAIISSVSSQPTGKKFTHNGLRTFAIGASADRFGGAIGYRHGIGIRNQKSEIRD